MRSHSLGFILCCSLLAGCGGLDSGVSSGGGGVGNIPDTKAVAIQDYSFAPATITVKTGTRIDWINDGPSSHSVTSDSTGFDSGALDAPASNGYGGMTNGGSFGVTFTKAGTYTYHCMFHANMHGTITVQ